MGVDTRQRADPAEVEALISGLIGSLSLERKVGQLMVSHVYGPAADSADQRNLRRFGVATPAEAVAEFSLGGVIYFRWSDNLLDPGQIAELSRGLRTAAGELSPGVGLDIGIDQETGPSSRLRRPLTEFPGAMTVAATGSTELCRQVFAATGDELRALGISTDFAPSADVNVNPANPVIGVRSFGSRPEQVADFTVAAIDGLQRDAGISAAAKHFPGHGDTASDSHETLPVITHSLADWRRIDRPPFATAVAAGVDLIMTAHLAFPELDPTGDPATLSRPILTGLLREDLGYDGVVITDSLEMAGVRSRYSDGEVAVRALEAGADVLLMPADPVAARDAVVRGVAGGRIAEERLNASLARVLRWKLRRAARQAEVAPVGLGTIGHHDHHELDRRVCAGAITVVHNEAGLVPIRGPVQVLGPDRAAALIAERFGALVAGHGAEPDVVVLLTSDAVHTDADRTAAGRDHLSHLAEARECGVPVVHVALTNPYDLGLDVGAGAALTGYSDTEATLHAVADVLLGLTPSDGRLPVDIVSAEDSSTIIYPAGTKG